ncbi:uncharacterized protein Z518_08953 [Rhinocladiella mackenziei CBS 650.93]|uniref:Cytochrome P450 monooxygenase n=1 Tax=Rhinocladiella mackenziei CBS 650.93 TaxID=1442369 RepID=A0A0D2GSB1_9EURO|nr:uncharacterized protein Z518_08953 [Rhinocladiella mackenziei CBS 650.93]KIX01228.1 hypothetical protein Z518_08953 [Rhinocladiella mackenziei CBS 650.93]
MAILSALFLLPGVPILCIAILRTYNLLINYLEAQKFGIPIKVLLFNRQDDIWLFVWRHFYPFFKLLPFNLGSWIDYSFHGWNVAIRFRNHEDLGDVFVLVTPNHNEIVTTDPVAGFELESKYKTWYKPQHHYHIFDLFGKNLLTVNGDEWQRHRKITSPAFREVNYKLVWNEALRQAKQMFQIARSRSQGQNYMEDIKNDSIIFAMHVLSAVGFGHAYDFDGGLRRIPPGHAVSFSDAMWFIFTKFLRIVMFRNLSLPGWLTPRWLVDIQTHLNEFRQYMEEAIDKQRRAGPPPVGSGADIISALIRANELVKNEEKYILTPAGKRSYLNDNELYGNMFILNLVGFEPPANAAMHVLPFLTSYREVQDWAGEEVDKVLGELDILQYEEVFPRLYETLRFWGPLGDTTRICLNEPQILRVREHELVVPPGVYVNWDFAGSQTDPRWWGPDSMEWRPQRWIKVDPATGHEILEAPSEAAEMAFNPWSGGPRVCPGKKFSQVEIVAMVATLLKSFRLKPMILPERGMRTEQDAQRELLSVTNDLELPRRMKGERMRDAGIVILDR